LPKDAAATAKALAAAFPENCSEEEMQRIFDSIPGPEDMTPAIAIATSEPLPATPKIAPPAIASIHEQAVAQGLEIASAADKGGEKGAQADVANQSIRVSIDVLESLMQMVGELVLTRNQLLQLSRQIVEKEFTGPIQRLSLITSDLQEQVMKTRMQPIGNAWAKFPRLIRDLSMELNKKIELRMIGAETEVPRWESAARVSRRSMPASLFSKRCRHAEHWTHARRRCSIAPLSH
jgi:two-component system chemotaxis sensor kinase CheA